MSIVDELEALKKLHESGTLNDAEFANAKTTILKGERVAEQASPSAPKPRRSKFLDPKENLKGLIRGAIVLMMVGIAGWLVLRYTVGEQIANRIFATAVRAPIEINDSVESLQSSSWKATGFRLPYSGTLTLTVEVLRGNPIDIFLVDENGLKQIKKEESGFSSIRGFQAITAKSFKQSARLEAGIYYVVLRDRTLGILSSCNSSGCHDCGASKDGAARPLRWQRIACVR